jgi:molybdate transport system substrate-binding protein
MGIGVFMKKGAVKPDIGSVDAFKRALLSAKAIVYKDPAVGDSSAIFTSALIQRLGIADEMKARTKVVAPADNIATVVRGDAEIGFDQMSNVVADARVEPIGALPPEIQHYTNYAAGVGADSKQQAAAIALIEFLRSRPSQAVMQTKGFTPL